MVRQITKLINNVILCLMVLYQCTTFIKMQTVTKTPICPHVCMCDHIERFVMCQEKSLAHIPYPLPLGTKLLGLSKNRFTSISPMTFSKKDESKITLESLMMYDNDISKIEAGSFNELIHLKNLWLFGNQLSDINPNTFGGLDNLLELDLSRNQIKVLKNLAFHGLTSLQNLQLWGNKLHTISPNAFYGLDNLNNITLGDNEFTEIPTSSFANLSNVTSLEILNLPISRLEKNGFSTLSKLEKLHIGDWPLLSYIDNAAFEGLQRLYYISLYRCNLRSVPQGALSKLTSLRHLLLSNNPEIKTLRAHDFVKLTNLEDLYLSNTGLTSLQESPFQLLDNLKSLDLSQNNLKNLPGHIFLQLENLHSLNISYNHIKAISSSAFANLNNLIDLDLMNNPLICDCDIKWLKSLQEINIRRHFVLKGTCDDPIQLNGTQLSALPPRKFICEPPSFKKDNQNVSLTVPLKHSVLLPCTPDFGVPSPTFEWKKTDSLPTWRLSPMLNGSLHFSSLQKQDYGSYLCVATNRFGFARRYVTLTEHEVPTELVAQESQSHLATGICVTLVIIAVLLIALYFLYRKYPYKIRRSSLYGMVMGDSESQRLSTSSIPKGE